MSNFDDDFLPERKASNNIYLTICEGQLCQRRATPTEGYEAYTMKLGSSAGRVVYLKRFAQIKGILTGFKAVDKETLEGKPYKVAQITFTSLDGARHAVVEAPVRGELVARFAKCVGNMDLGEPVLMRTFLDKESQLAIFFEQNGEKIPQAYTSDNPNGLPAWEKDPITGEWDNRAYWKFLFDVIFNAIPLFERNKKLLEQSRAVEDPAPESEAQPEPLAAAAAAGSPDDDIPF